MPGRRSKGGDAPAVERHKSVGNTYYLARRRLKMNDCTKCKSPLYQMYTFSGVYPASQCLNRDCPKYGKPQSFKKGKKQEVTK